MINKLSKNFVISIWGIIIILFLLNTNVNSALLHPATILPSINKNPIIKINVLNKNKTSKNNNYVSQKPIVTIKVINNKNKSSNNVIIKNSSKKSTVPIKYIIKPKNLIINTEPGVNKSENGNNITTGEVNKKTNGVDEQLLKISVNGVILSSVIFGNFYNVSGYQSNSYAVAMIENRITVNIDEPIFKKLGITFVRDKRNGIQSVYLIRGKDNIKLSEKKQVLVLNKSKFRIMDIAPYINTKGKFCIPLRFVLENFNVAVDWNNNNSQSINILTT